MNIAQVLLFVVFVFVKFTDQEPLEAFTVPPVLIGKQQAVSDLTNGLRLFSQQLYPTIGDASRTGLLFSPVCLFMTLIAVFMGARGSTQDELSRLLGLLEINEETLQLAEKLIKHASGSPNYTDIDVRLFIDKSVILKDDFKRIIGPIITLVDFKNALEETREYINSWAGKSTYHTIKDLLTPGSISDKTRLVLADYLHFKAIWQTKFDKTLTRERQFYVTSTEQRAVQMMNVKGVFNFYNDRNNNLKILRLDYEGGLFEMLIFLPDNVLSHSDLEAKAKTANLFEIGNYTVKTVVDVYLPRFNIEMTTDFSILLQLFGFGTMFGEGADFGGITDERIAVSSVVQKAILDVNEDGIETSVADPVSVADLQKSVGSGEPETFTADRPFVFLVRLKQLPIFHVLLGKYSGPN